MFRDKDFYLATTTLIGTIIGVGVFGIPYVAAQSNFFLGLIYIVVIGIIVLLVHLAYAEVILRTHGRYRLIGYAQKYLGKKGKILVTFSTVLGLYGALLAYIIVGGQFLYSLLGWTFGGTPFVYSLILFSLAALAIFWGLKLVVKGELVMTLLLLATVGVLLLFGLPHLKTGNFLTFNYKNIFLPYGVVLFALKGGTAIPEMRSILLKKGKYLKGAVILGTIVPIIVYTLFSFIIVGVTGLETSPEAMTGLIKMLGDGTVIIGSFFGFLAVATSFLIIGLNLKESFWYDYKLPHGVSWLLACFIPLILFLWGSRDFIKVIGLVGGLMGGINGMVMIWLYWRAKKVGQRQPEFSFNLPRAVGILIIAIFVLGVVYEVFYSLGS